MFGQPGGQPGGYVVDQNHQDLAVGIDPETGTGTGTTAAWNDWKASTAVAAASGGIAGGGGMDGDAYSGDDGGGGIDGVGWRDVAGRC